MADDEEVDVAEFKEKLDRVIFEKTQAIEQKRVMDYKKLKKIEKIEDNGLRKRLLYNAEKQKNKAVSTPSAEERELHEAYQFLIREYEARHNVSNNFVTPQPSVKKRKPRRGSHEVVSVYKGEKDFYEKVHEALPHEAPNLEHSLCVGVEELLQPK